MRWAVASGWILAGLLAVAAGRPAAAQGIQDLQQLSISQLEHIDVTSVTKTAVPLNEAPGAVYVITADDIARSGSKTIPEILRLAPNLQVIELGAGHYIITARGLTGNIADQNFANKLLVLIDGRSVYTPLYSGVYWDSQDVVAADIDRIEVISGPGATLWGANAVNGVINIITRKASQTQGGLLDIAAGNLSQTATLRYGGTLSDTLAYRVYVSDYSGSDTETQSGANPHDHWQKPQGGFRLDWDATQDDSVTLQGDVYDGWKSSGGPNEDIEGHNLLAQWNHGWDDGSAFQAIAYYDHVHRGNIGGGRFWQDTFNLDLQNTFTLGDRHTITWGGNYRATDYVIHGTSSLYYAPANRTLLLADGFAQDSIAVTPALTAVLGLKLEDDPYSGLSALPSGRLSWNVDDKTMIWTAMSRAIRSPTPFDRDVQERVGSLIALYGDEAFTLEDLTAYELGVRTQVDAHMSLSLSSFYNRYNDLRTVELTTGAASLLDLTWGNNLKGETYGFDLWGEYRLTGWWHLSASLSELVEHFRFKPGASAPFIGTSQLGDDPEQTASLRSSMNLSSDVNLDLGLRYQSELPNPKVPGFVEGDASIGWNVSDRLRLSLSGYNLLHAKHFEFPAPDATAVPRSFSVGLQWRF